MDTVEFKEKTILTTLYQENSISYRLTSLAAFLELWYTLSILDSVVTNFMMGIIVFLNIFLMFTLFTAAVKIKVYSKMWSFIAMAIGVYQFIRAVLILPLLLNPFKRVPLLITLNVCCSVLLIIAGIKTLSIIKKRNPYLKMENDNE